MVGLDRRQSPLQPVATDEHCVTMARIYQDQRRYFGDVRRLRKHGWKVVYVRQQPTRLSIDRIRSSAACALLPGKMVELVAYYTRCGEAPRKQRISRVLRRRR